MERVAGACAGAVFWVAALGACSGSEGSETSGPAGDVPGLAGASGAAGVAGGAGPPTGGGGGAPVAGAPVAGTPSGTGGAGGSVSPDAGPPPVVDAGPSPGTPDAGPAPIDAGSSSSGDFDCSAAGATDHFSFFVTSYAGLQRLSGSPDGFGGDLRYGEADGLSGADKICRELADASSPGAGCKTWRAFLSVTAGLDGQPVHAGDRIGEGPWYDRLGRIVAMTKSDLLQPWPVGADPVIMTDLPNEDGVPNHDPDGTGFVDNHNTVTGTAAGGMLVSPDWAFTCHDWTSSVGEDGTPAIGFSWIGGAASVPGSGWYHSMGITEGGCAPYVNLTDFMDFSIRGIGARGGYGGFYCLALEP